MSDIAKRILETMREQNLSYAELSLKTGISKSALQRYATGSTPKIPMDRMESIAAALGVSLAYLMGWETDYTQLMAAIIEENKSGRPAAANEMRRLFGTKHGTLSTYICEEDRDKVSVLFYQAMERYAAMELSSIIDVLKDEDYLEIERIRRLISAYRKADDPIKEIVDTALRPYDEPGPIDA